MGDLQLAADRQSRFSAGHEGAFHLGSSPTTCDRSFLSKQPGSLKFPRSILAVPRFVFFLSEISDYVFEIR